MPPRRAIEATAVMTIDVDTREQSPYTFKDIRGTIPFEVRRVGLPTADYRVDRFLGTSTKANCAIVERKTLTDLYGTATMGRERFEAELKRMTEYGFRALVIEAEWSQILNPNAFLVRPTKMLPKAMLASLLAWQQRFGLHVLPCPGRRAAEIITFRLLERWYRDLREQDEETVA